MIEIEINLCSISSSIIPVLCNAGADSQRSADSEFLKKEHLEFSSSQKTYI